jgi:hypothetical protein
VAEVVRPHLHLEAVLGAAVRTDGHSWDQFYNFTIWLLQFCVCYGKK